jgi:hypothetical protein
MKSSSTPAAVLLAGVSVFAIAACGSGSASQNAAANNAATAADSTPADAAATAAADQQAADLAAREQELARREAELQAKLAATAPTPKPVSSAAKAPAPRPAAPAPVATTASLKQPAPVAAPPPPPVTIPAGTQMSVKLNSAYSTKTTTLGETVNAELASDLVVDGRRVARAGAPISGTVTEVTSGSHKIGAVPALKIDFTQLVVANGSTSPVHVRVMQKGASEKGRDTAKIAGGTAAGAIIGHQVDSDKGKVIGGILGGAAGAIAAHKTGTEVEIPAGSVVPANVRTAFNYDGG